MKGLKINMNEIVEFDSLFSAINTSINVSFGSALVAAFACVGLIYYLSKTWIKDPWTQLLLLFVTPLFVFFVMINVLTKPYLLTDCDASTDENAQNIVTIQCHDVDVINEAITSEETTEIQKRNFAYLITWKQNSTATPNKIIFLLSVVPKNILIGLLVFSLLFPVAILITSRLNVKP
jgi:hypothetical protein